MEAPETMCDESRTKPQRGSGEGRYCVVDHANKQGDRERPNPNGSLIWRLRSELFGPGSLPGRHGRESGGDSGTVKARRRRSGAG